MLAPDTCFYFGFIQMEFQAQTRGNKSLPEMHNARDTQYGGADFYPATQQPKQRHTAAYNKEQTPATHK
jgi:hypothetical protein